MTILDIFKGFCTGYYENGELIDNKEKIISQYIHNDLPYDILSLIAILINRLFFPKMDVTLTYIINLFFFLKSHIVNNILNKIDKVFQIP